MKQFLLSFFKSALLVLFPGLLFAQQKNDYRILLNSGKFTPAANAGSISQTSDVFSKSLFQDKHYVTIQFNALPNENRKKELSAAGIELIDYIPNMAYTAVVNKGINVSRLSALNVRAVFKFTPAQKTVSALLKENFPAHAIKAPGFVDVNVIIYEKLSAQKIQAAFAALKVTILEDAQVFRRFTIRIPQNNLKQLVALAFVQWVEFIDPPNRLENLPGRTLHRVNILNDGVRNLKGDGINIGIWDGGAISPHLDFSPAGRLTQVEASAVSDHSTHCSGTILGRGLRNPLAKGMAPNAKLYSYNFSGNIQSEMAAGIPLYNLAVSSHSYGSTQTCGVNGAGVTYSNASRETDINLNNFPYHLHCHSAGNSQSACAGGWSTITASGKSAKNNILVANITSTEGISGSSSFGPVQDGRVKPEISAMGTNVFSTVSAPLNYDIYSGTSMATPGVSGTVALLVQRYKQLNGGTLPPSTLIKNVILNTANDLGNAGPDYRFGYGRINALQAVRILEPSVRYVLNNVTTGTTNDLALSVPAGAARLRVMLTWNDPAGTANANPALVNNLDLSVINGATTTLPWILDKDNPANPATRAVDNVSNIEQVTIDNPAAGSYTMRVNGLAVPTGANQPYALTWSVEMPYIEVIYPNGAESFNPFSNEVITWDNAGITGNQTIEYSLDNGSTWTILSTTVPPATKRFTFSIPGANTSTALVRISGGSITDVSDATFKILGTATGFAVATGAGCSSGEVSFTWNAVTNATHYDIYQLDAVTGQFIILSANVIGTSHTATGLTPGASMWFTIIAKNNTTGAISERAVAINATVSSGGGGLGVVGSISGQNNICGNPTAISYSISPVTGATSYSWAIPSGAIITGGQGTTAITVSYPGGSNNGNVAVFASNGSCQTTPSSLAITVGAAVSAPLTGGDQSQTVCPGGTVSTLTATATAPAGHTIVWYNTASGGTAIASPTQSTIGTTTYHAAARNTSSGCESTVRTAVVLTIATVPAASATAGGALNFCQGGNVILTAGIGSSYVWNRNGVAVSSAFSQTYTATTSGSYTVTVTTGTCTSTSTPIVVTVNTSSPADVTASGATAICQGGNVVLTASAGSSWLWSTSATTQSITVNTAGSYSVTVTNASGCTAASSATAVTVSPSLIATISAAPYRNLFPGLKTTLTANVNPPGVYNYIWFKNGIIVPGATSSSLSGIDYSGLGSYTVTATNATGMACSNTSPAFLVSDSATAKMFVYPSPNRGKFNVVYYAPAPDTKYTLSIYDGKGARAYGRAYSLSTAYQQMNVDMRQNGKGVYRVVLSDKTGKAVAVGSVIIE